ncbi:InlB B-repeat-containing protein, partial [Candidatus Saccharibacteria bacterium]|nr:InlB B-repeat-containing protein [Candidatus Saccharibacteria bacterium]
STNIIKDDNTAESDSAFYDFYIRTCWYGNDGETPSTISTVVRLYDPLRTSEIEEAKVAMLRYNDNSNGGATTDGLIGKKLLAGGTEAISAVEPVWPGHNFLGWCTSLPSGGSCNGATIKYDNNRCTITEDGKSVNAYKNLISVNSSGACEYAAPANLTENSYFSLYAIWERIGYVITYNANGGSYKSGSSQKTQVCYYDEPCIIPSAEEEQPRHAYGEFKGWSTSPTANVPNALYAPGSIIAPTNLTLYAVWQKKNGVFAVVAEWNQNADFESNVIGWKSNGQAFTAYFNATSFSDIDNTPLAILHQDCTSDCHPQNEVFILNTMGGRDYYYYICRYSPGVCGGSVSKDSGITVKLYIKDEETGDTYLTIGGNAANKYDGNYSLVETYSIADAKGDSYGRYWNVFAFKNGWIVNPGGDYVTTISNYVNQSY